MKSMSIAEQTTKGFKEYLLDSFCYEFYEHLDGYEESTIEEVANEIVKGIQVFAAGLSLQEIVKVVSEVNDDLFADSTDAANTKEVDGGLEET